MQNMRRSTLRTVLPNGEPFCRLRLCEPYGLRSVISVCPLRSPALPPNLASLFPSSQHENLVALHLFTPLRSASDADFENRPDLRLKVLYQYSCLG